MSRRIAVVTGSRAEYGLLRHVVRRLRARHAEVRLVVTGSHLAPGFGDTIGEVEADRWSIAERVEMLVAGDSGAAMAASMGLGMIGLAGALERIAPDVVLLLGDRFEIFAAAATAAALRIPIAHIAGGESTAGAVDDAFRHAITKLAQYHFVATETYRRRVLQLGEDPRRVFLVGATGLDGLREVRFLSPRALLRSIGLAPDHRPIGACTYHPVTLAADSGEAEARILGAAMARFPEIRWIVTKPNSDAGGGRVERALREVLAGRGVDAAFVASLGQRRYLSLLRHAVVMVGNSSSGILEAPAVGLPAVNLGRRQEGRVRAANVLDVPRPTVARVVAAIRTALTPAFRRRSGSRRNPYDFGNASNRIAETLLRVPLGARALDKGFHDLPTARLSSRRAR